MCLHFAFLFSVALCVNCNCAYSMFMLEHNGSMLFYGEASVQVVRRQAGKNLLASYFKVSYELMNCTKTWLFSIFWKLPFCYFFIICQNFLFTLILVLPTFTLDSPPSGASSLQISARKQVHVLMTFVSYFFLGPTSINEPYRKPATL